MVGKMESVDELEKLPLTEGEARPTSYLNPPGIRSRWNKHDDARSSGANEYGLKTWCENPESRR